MSVNASSVLKVLDDHFESKECKEKIKKKQLEYIKKGVYTTNAGSKIIDDDYWMNVAEMLRECICSRALSHDLPESVMSDIYSMRCFGPYIQGEDVRFDLVFVDNLSRKSLYPEEYDDGLENIIALFNTGIKANGEPTSNYAYGWWDNHEYDNSKDPSGEVAWKSRGVTGSIFVKSKRYREPLRFIQEGIEEFKKMVNGKVDISTISVKQIYIDGTRQ